MRSRSFGTLMSSVAADASVRLLASPLGGLSAARSRLFCTAKKQRHRNDNYAAFMQEEYIVKTAGSVERFIHLGIAGSTGNGLESTNKIAEHLVITFLMKLLLLWTRLNAGPIAWLELVSLETKGGAWTCNTSASSRGGSLNLPC